MSSSEESGYDTSDSGDSNASNHEDIELTQFIYDVFHHHLNNDIPTRSVAIHEVINALVQFMILVNIIISHLLSCNMWMGQT